MGLETNDFAAGRQRQLDRFGDETAAASCRILGADWVSFYQIGPGRRPHAFRNIGVTREFHQGYVGERMEEVDPLHPFRLSGHRSEYFTLQSAREVAPRRGYRSFHAFLADFRVRHCAEMLFVAKGRAVAGMSLIWLAERAPRERIDAQARALCRYADFALRAMLSEPAVSDCVPYAPDPSVLCTFTQREQAIVELVCRGMANAQVARHLNIGLATVKTHLIHVYSKAGVTSRAELMAKLLRTADGHDDRVAR